MVGDEALFFFLDHVFLRSVFFFRLFLQIRIKCTFKDTRYVLITAVGPSIKHLETAIKNKFFLEYFQMFWEDRQLATQTDLEEFLKAETKFQLRLRV